MAEFLKQIKEDFEEYRIKWPTIQHIDKDEWAFNFWVLDKLFSVDEDIIESNIVDYQDKGMDCFVWHEDTRDLYIIQNKYYGDETKVDPNYVKTDFLVRPIGALRNNGYTRSPELQAIYNKFKDDEEFSVYFYLYVTNNTSKTRVLEDVIKEYNSDNVDNQYTAKVFYLDDIEKAYYDEPIKEKKVFKFKIATENKGTRLQVLNAAYKMTLAVDAKYLLTPVMMLYQMVKEANKKGYPLFDENIREYLGSNGSVNKAIKNTLTNSKERRNFFFYNNGITIIVDKLGTEAQNTSTQMLEQEITNPQIVNGCQTVSTIFETLDGLREETLAEEFADTYVMVKLLEIPPDDDNAATLYKNIVTYNNSQNSINEKQFVAVSDVFKRVQNELLGKGFLLCIKQSDKNKFKNQYKTASTLLKDNKAFLDKFGIDDIKKTDDFIVQLEKFLQVLISFVDNPIRAIQKKSRLLVRDSDENKRVVDFIKDPNLTSNDYLYLYLLYMRAEQERKKDDGRTPNPFYFIHCIARYECNGDVNQISTVLKDIATINELVLKYKNALKRYYDLWRKENEGKEYNDMIKTPLNYRILDDAVEYGQSILDAVKNQSL